MQQQLMVRQLSQPFIRSHSPPDGSRPSSICSDPLKSPRIPDMHCERPSGESRPPRHHSLRAARALPASTCRACARGVGSTLGPAIHWSLRLAQLLQANDLHKARQNCPRIAIPRPNDARLQAPQSTAPYSLFLFSARSIASSREMISVRYSSVAALLSSLCASCIEFTIRPTSRFTTANVVTMMNGTKNTHA